MATYHFRTRSGRRPATRARLIKLAGQLEVQGEALDIKVKEPLQDGEWCPGVIAASTSVYFKIGTPVRILPDVSDFLLELE